MIIASHCKFIEERKEGRKGGEKEKRKFQKKRKRKRERRKKKIRDETDLVSKIGGGDKG